MTQHEIQALFDEFRKLHQQLDSVKKSIAGVSDKYASDDIKELAAALAKAQGEYRIIGYNRINPYFKSEYADLDTIMRAVRPALAKHGLSFMQQTKITEDGATILHSILMHASGQWIESRNRIIPPKNDQQTYGSTLTYQKRYAAISLLGITVSHDNADDDAEVAMIDSRDIIAKGPALHNKYNPRDESPEVVSKEQLEELEYELSEYPDLAEEILSKMQLQSLADMPKSKYLVAVKRIREIKNLRNGVK